MDDIPLASPPDQTAGYAWRKLWLLRLVRERLAHLLTDLAALLVVRGRGARWRRRFAAAARIAASLGMAFGMLFSHPTPGFAGGAGFTEAIGTDNPLDGLTGLIRPTPVLVDINGDNRLDIFIGHWMGTVRFFLNTTPDPPFDVLTLTEQTGTDNPLDGVDVGFGASPAFGDIDGDGDLDAFIAEYTGSIHYFENTGTKTTPVFAEQTGAANPFDGVSVPTYTSPTFADIDGDGDLDAFTGEFGDTIYVNPYGYTTFGVIHQFENTGTRTAPVMVERIAGANLFDGLTLPWSTTPEFADIDGDGDLDAFMGDYYGNIHQYKNTGTLYSPVFEELTGDANQAKDIIVGAQAHPTFGDMDNDGDLDAFVGNNAGLVRYFVNTGYPTTTVANLRTPDFTEINIASGYFAGQDMGTRAAPVFADLDGDADPDAIFGNGDGTVLYYRNNGTRLAPSFAQQVGVNNPFDGLDFGENSRLTFADFDADNDQDALVGEQTGAVHYLENTGNREAPAFTERTGAANPLDGVTGNLTSAPVFVDIDDDADMDVFIGDYYGDIRYYRNAGTVFAPLMVEDIGPSNPLSGVQTLFATSPAFVDVEGDGDLDVFLGSQDGQLRYYQNIGKSRLAEFSLVTGAFNPFNGYGVGASSVPAFVDVDSDGDMDAFVGNVDGAVFDHRSAHCSFENDSWWSVENGDTLVFGFGDSEMIMKINQAGDPPLTDVGVTCHPASHPSAPPGLQNGVYWEVGVTPGAGTNVPFDVDLTLRMKNATPADDKLCVYTGTGSDWECAVSSNTLSSVTRSGLNASTLRTFWTVGDNVDPTTVKVAKLSARSGLPAAWGWAAGGLALLGAAIARRFRHKAG